MNNAQFQFLPIPSHFDNASPFMFNFNSEIINNILKMSKATFKDHVQNDLITLYNYRKGSEKSTPKAHEAGIRCLTVLGMILSAAKFVSLLTFYTERPSWISHLCDNFCCTLFPK